MKSRRLRNYVRPERRRVRYLRSAVPLTVEQIRQIEANWERHGGGRVQVQIVPPTDDVVPPPGWPHTTLNEPPTPWWRRWFR